MEFATTYENRNIRAYPNHPNYFSDIYFLPPDIEKSTISIKDIGASVPEGRQFGSFIQTVQGMIRKGTGKIELSTAQGGGMESVGAESYGLDARQALRELAKANEIEFVSVHTPPNVGNMSGYNPQERGFNDEYRKHELDEVKRAIEFAADTGSSAVVVHTGEYQRDISAQPWARDEEGRYRFLSFNEEPSRQVLYLVDERTGKLITEVRKSLVVHEPKFLTRPDPNQGGRERWIDKDGNFIDETNVDALFHRVPVWMPDRTRFDTRRLTWDDFVERANAWNKYYPRYDGRPWTPEELFFRSQMETRILQARGSSLFHGRSYDAEKETKERLEKALNFFKKIEKETPVEQQWQLLEEMEPIRGYAGHAGRRYVRGEKKLPSEIIQEALKSVELSMRYTHEASASADAQADETTETLRHVVPVEVYAKRKTAESYAEAGIHAMEVSHESKHAKKEVYVAPENIFPEMGFGSHPEELIELVKLGRQKMVEYLTSPKIPSPSEKRTREGEIELVQNPYYRPGMSKEEAEEEARKHIRATLDTQHLGMWWKHFQPLPGETPEQRKERFDKWYMEMIEKLEKEDVIGHIHVVDAIGGGHQHLPVGQGNLPIRKALEYLKGKNYGGTMISEAYGEEATHGQGRILTETWRALGSPIRGVGYAIGAPGRWTDVQWSYFSKITHPYFIFGAYAPSNDWQLWSQVPFE
ncbi:MAG: TIM barrel protein [Candidatus Woesearchaeota archaeon]